MVFSAISSHLAAYYACFGTPQGFFLHFDQVMEIVFGINIVKNFFLMYRDPNDPVTFIRDFFQIVKHYVRGAFALDLMALSAWPLFLILRETVSPDMANLIYLLRLFRLRRILILLNLQRFALLVRKSFYSRLKSRANNKEPGLED